MSKDKASTEASPDEQSSRGYDLCEEIDKKLGQARGICGVLMEARNIDDPIREALSAAEELIEDTQKASEELRDIYEGRTPKEIQS